MGKHIKFQTMKFVIIKVTQYSSDLNDYFWVIKWFVLKPGEITNK